jgi:polyphosphate kinase 2 (PPK2 family)
MAPPILFDPVDSPHLVPFDGSFKLCKLQTNPDGNAGKEANVDALGHAIEKLCKLQEKLYAHDRYSVLLVFQAMDAAGKDGTIRAVMTGINPQGCQVYAFKSPNAEELDHDFLWRVQRCLPERGRIGIWNRSHYEEVLVVRVNPGYLDHQKLPRRPEDLADLWAERYESIAAAEQHWARNGCVILKFFLNVSQREQHRRFLERVTSGGMPWRTARRNVSCNTSSASARLPHMRSAMRRSVGLTSANVASRSSGAFGSGGSAICRGPWHVPEGLVNTTHHVDDTASQHSRKIIPTK